MKNVKFLLPNILFLSAVFIFEFSSCAPKQQIATEASESAQTTTNKKTISSDITLSEKSDGLANTIRKYEVFGMNCPGCHGGLEKLINKIDGVISCKANWEMQYLKVVVSAGVELDDELIFAAIKSANFTSGKRLN